MLFSFSLIFFQFHPGVAYKIVPYIKKRVHSLLEILLFRVIEVVVFTFLVLCLNLVHISGPRKAKTRCPGFDFSGGLSNAICDLILYLLRKCQKFL